MLATAALLTPLFCPSSSPPTSERPPEVDAWLAASAIPLASFAPDAPLDDLAPLAAKLADVRIVALGEATHGSHEFFAFKARALVFLVSELGFTDFALESGWAEAEAADAWVQGGEGSVEGALGSFFALWQVREYAALLEWMRAWNADPAHARKLHLHGLDIAAPGLPAARLKDYLARVDGDLAEHFGPLLAQVGGMRGGGAGGTGPTAEGEDLAALVAICDELEADWVERTSRAEWVRARHDAVGLQQFWIHQRERSGNDQLGYRDRCMADQARWILAQDPSCKLVLSAHNGHVSRDGLAIVAGYGRIESLGHALTADAQRFPDERLTLVVLGCAFARGEFRSYGPGPRTLRTFRLEQPLEASLEAALHETGIGPALLDLRSAPASGPVHDWLVAPRTMRGIGGYYDPDWPLDQTTRLTSVPSEYDLLLWVPEVHAAEEL